ncbi:hypothetical protein LZ30DRAFT_402895 [Colletotrichum cereale]|nr:hypothetical protein LZ30DRAFT_402895 [Colletotrichum cereale]
MSSWPLKTSGSSTGSGLVPLVKLAYLRHRQAPVAVTIIRERMGDRGTESILEGRGVSVIALSPWNLPLLVSYIIDAEDEFIYSYQTKQLKSTLPMDQAVALFFAVIFCAMPLLLSALDIGFPSSSLEGNHFAVASGCPGPGAFDPALHHPNGPSFESCSEGNAKDDVRFDMRFNCDGSAVDEQA